MPEYDQSNKSKEEGDSYLNNPSALSDIQNMLDNGRDEALQKYKKLPLSIKRRVNALKNIQLEAMRLDEEFNKEIMALEAKMLEKMKPFVERRKKIVEGIYEPSGEEVEWKLENSDDEEEVDELADGVAKTSIGNGDTKELVIDEEDSKGIPEFWLTVFDNVPMLASNIQDNDREPLKSLYDITIEMDADKEPKFVILFHFKPNDYFTDEVLKKTYYLCTSIDPESPFSYEGTEIQATIGCPINWKQGQNITKKLVKKTQKNKHGDKKTTTKTVKVDSFFNFFDPPTESLADSAALDSDTVELLEADFEIGQFIKENIVPRAVLYFTGEALDDESDDEYEDEDDEDDEDDDADDSDEAGDDKKKNRSSRKNGGKQGEDCKQQ